MMLLQHGCSALQPEAAVQSGLRAASALLPLGSSTDCQDSCSQLRNYQLEGMHVLTQLRRFVALCCDHMVARCTCVICYSTSKPLHKPQRHLLSLQLSMP